MRPLLKRLDYRIRHNHDNDDVWRLGAQGKKSLYTGSETIVGLSEVYAKDPRYITIRDADNGQFLFPRSLVNKEHRRREIRVPMNKGKMTGTALRSDLRITTDNKVVRYEPRTGGWETIVNGSFTAQGQPEVRPDDRHFSFVDAQTKDLIAVPKNDSVAYLGRNARIDVSDETFTVPDIDKQKINKEKIESYRLFDFAAHAMPLNKLLKNSDINGIQLQVTIDPHSEFLILQNDHGYAEKIDMKNSAFKIKEIRNEFYAERAQAFSDEELLGSLSYGEVECPSSKTKPFDWPQLKLPLRMLLDPRQTGQVGEASKLKLGSSYVSGTDILRDRIAHASQVKGKATMSTTLKETPQVDKPSARPLQKGSASVPSSSLENPKAQLPKSDMHRLIETPAKNGNSSGRSI